MSTRPEVREFAVRGAGLGAEPCEVAGLQAVPEE